MMSQTPHVVVIGAGIGGITTAALLLKAGLNVSLFEAHIYPGGSAGTFYHQGYRFDAGATLAGGFFKGGPHQKIAEMLEIEFPVSQVDPAWIVHLPDNKIYQWCNREKWYQERLEKFPGSEPFWQKQEQLAKLSWKLSQKYFPYPPQNLKEYFSLLRLVQPDYLPLIPNLLKSIESLASNELSPSLRTFLDAQLLISAQTTSQFANAIYGSAALDLPRRGIVYLQGGIGTIANKLASWFKANGGKLYYRQRVKLINKHGNQWLVRTQKGHQEMADIVVANLTPHAFSKILADGISVPHFKKSAKEKNDWGAFTLYLGLEKESLADIESSHHQVVLNPELPLGEGNSIFLSLNDLDDDSRAPKGHLTATISTHTRVLKWWHLANHDPQSYQAQKDLYTEKVLTAAETAIPGIRNAVRLILPGTPVTFQFYTGRPNGSVGGYPQTSLFNVRSPATGLKNIWLVGDSIFPGQSTAAVSIGAMRVAQSILDSL